MNMRKFFRMVLAIGIALIISACQRGNEAHSKTAENPQAGDQGLEIPATVLKPQAAKNVIQVNPTFTTDGKSLSYPSIQQAVDKAIEMLQAAGAESTVIGIQVGPGIYREDVLIAPPASVKGGITFDFRPGSSLLGSKNPAIPAFKCAAPYETLSHFLVGITGMFTLGVLTSKKDVYLEIASGAVILTNAYLGSSTANTLLKVSGPCVFYAMNSHFDDYNAVWIAPEYTALEIGFHQCDFRRGPQDQVILKIEGSGRVNVGNCSIQGTLWIGNGATNVFIYATAIAPSQVYHAGAARAHFTTPVINCTDGEKF